MSAKGSRFKSGSEPELVLQPELELALSRASSDFIEAFDESALVLVSIGTEAGSAATGAGAPAGRGTGAGAGTGVGTGGGGGNAGPNGTPPPFVGSAPSAL